jgi:formate dehydrogenase iron-sulfur subunit
VALDERVERGELLRHFWRFAASESCGTCAPCRLGTRRGLAAAEGSRTLDRSSEREMLQAMEHGSLCAFGRTVPAVIRSIGRAIPA